MVALLKDANMDVDMDTHPDWETDLFQWGRCLGCRPLDVKVDTAPYGGRCLLCTTAKDVGDLIVSIPRQMVITAQSVTEKDERIGKLVQNLPDEIASGKTTLTLMLFLIAEKNSGADSLYQEYINTIPVTYTTPFYASDEHVQSMLAGTPLLFVYQSVREELVSNFKALCETITKFSDLSPITWEEFLWAYHVVESRSFTTMMDGQETNMLVPLVDLADHHPTEGRRVTKMFNSETQCFEVKAASKFAAGEQLYLQYGDVQNWQLVIYYGFALHDNVFDSFDINLELPSDDTPADSMRRSLLLTLGENSGMFNTENKLSIGADGAFVVTPTLLPTLRLLTADGVLLEKMTVQNLETYIKDASASKERELRMFESLSAMFKATLEAYPTPLDDDLARLSEDGVSSFETACLVYRIGQKRLLTAGLGWVDQQRRSL
ncbi:hypothetical protein SARC_08990 [Sphaeroforma arctica JP610]|uniref:Rubisco LSMT substrate-binding domain-containing protein n=1 Tax=Sphaeroforma arctica JP610 TaxID=667725 RepID=A0A0L0FQ10_9EUKA|nr:hypothetical protein SARC_08990 [Sphaeroforma arctica JP610]KNC78591.1 hypothetical protein SARC_08990 [Sphaeroforma arctica JP610]|eukprot:XP_014152493.1 hypothetical protein SARC_08990 [Sphaeroforma arctica JP610]